MAAVRASTPTEAHEPHVRRAQQHLLDARKALERPMWNRAQVDDAMRSVEHFMNHARTVLAPLTKED